MILEIDNSIKALRVPGVLGDPKHGRWCNCNGRRYTCPGCKRFVPECFGAADDLPDLCDDCWFFVHPLVAGEGV